MSTEGKEGDDKKSLEREADKERRGTGREKESGREKKRREGGREGDAEITI